LIGGGWEPFSGRGGVGRLAGTAQRWSVGHLERRSSPAV